MTQGYGYLRTINRHNKHNSIEELNFAKNDPSSPICVKNAKSSIDYKYYIDF